MRIAELIEELQRFHPEEEVMVSCAGRCSDIWEVARVEVGALPSTRPAFPRMLGSGMGTPVVVLR